MAETIVLYPSSGIGHLIPMVELGKLILGHHPSFSITILILTPTNNKGCTASSISLHHLSNSSLPPNINLHCLPSCSLPPNTDPVNLAFELPRLSNPSVHQVLQTISQSSKIKAFIIDFFNYAASEVSASFSIPTYYFFTCCASGLAAFLYLPTLHQNSTTSFKDLNTLVTIPGVPPVPSSDMATAILAHNAKQYKNFLNSANDLSESKGIIINTFELLETRVIKAISDGLCVPNKTTPPIYCIGPVIAQGDGTLGGNNGHECLNWLNSQPSQSVVFLCFGSMGFFSAEQLLQMAIGLERSGHRFLWVVRSPPTINKSHSTVVLPELDLEDILPKGFLERTKDRGLVVKSWAPQVAVLSHESVGGFVTHCGWNSVLEAICAGVPMLAWPLYAEQKMNRVFMVEEMKVALRMNESKDGFVSAYELERRVGQLMDSEEGKKVRDRVVAMRDVAGAAMKEGGSSHVALAQLAELWKQG